MQATVKESQKLYQSGVKCDPAFCFGAPHVGKTNNGGPYFYIIALPPQALYLPWYVENICASMRFFTKVVD